MLAVPGGDRGRLFTQDVLGVWASMSLYGAVTRSSSTGCRGEGGVRGAAEPCASFPLPAGVSTSRLRVQHLKDASYNEFGEYQLITERTIVPNKKTEN